MPKSDWSTAVGDVGHGSITVRGYALEEIIGSLSFGTAVFLAVRGELPTAGQARVMDAALCSILEHGFYAPTTLAARMVASTTPGTIIPGLAAGVLTIGNVTASPQHSAEVIDRVGRLVAEGTGEDKAAKQVATEMMEAGQRMPGIGHPLHPEGDPRAAALEAVAREHGLRGLPTQRYMAVRDVYVSQVGRPLPVNVDGMLGCVLAELGFEPAAMPGIAALSFLPGMIAHCVEELSGPIRLRVADGDYVGPEPRPLPPVLA